MEFLNILRKEEISELNKIQINEIFNLGFNKPLENNSFDLIPFDLMCLLSIDDKVIGFACIEKKYKDVMKPLSNIYYLLHTISVHPNYRGKGYCSLLVKEIIKKFGRKHSLYLSVETDSRSPNKNAIKCYQKNGFRLVDCLYEPRPDNKICSYMVRVKGPFKKSKNLRKTKRK
tara:strand:- start:441 stop:959 length:519 start_codon:yes stop_codon:yes gene_type:complete